MSVAPATDTDAQFEPDAGTPGIEAPDTDTDDDLDLGYPDDEEFEVPEIDIDAETGGRLHRMRQMGAKRIGSLAIGIGVVGIVLNEMNSLAIVSNSSGVIDVGSIFSIAGEGLNLLVIGVIIAAAAVLLSLWSGF